MDVPLEPTTTSVYILFAAVLPLIIALLKQTGWSTRTNALIAFGAYIVTGAGAAVLSGLPLTIENVVPLASIATVVGSACYALIWKNLGEQALTAATSIVK